MSESLPYDRNHATKVRLAFSNVLRDTAATLPLGSTRLREIVEARLVPLNLRSAYVAACWSHLREQGVLAFSDYEPGNVQLVQPRAREFLHGFPEAVVE